MYSYFFVCRVLVQIGGTRDFSAELKSTETELHNLCADEDSKPNIDINNKFAPHFQIDWCKYKLVSWTILSKYIL